MSVVDSKFESMDSKATWKVEVLTARKSESMNVTAQITKVTWRIENFSSIKNEKLYSEIFIVDGNKWRIILHIPRRENWLLVCLEIVDSANLPISRNSYAQFGFAIIDQIDRKSSITKDSTMAFRLDLEKPVFGFPSILLSEFHDPKRGYLIKDACLVEVFVSTDMYKRIISHDFMLQTDGPSEEDMNTFFTSLEAQLHTSCNVFSHEDAKEALAKVDEALNMTPIDLKFYRLKHAFKILARLKGSSIPVETEHKNELLVVEERMKELADRAVKAAQDKHHLTENQSMKLKITRTLDRNLIRFSKVEQKLAALLVERKEIFRSSKEIKMESKALGNECPDYEAKANVVDSKVKQVEQKLAALLAERKEIFKSSKEMKMELEALGNECPDYEAKAKVVEKEEKTVEAEWARLKAIISYIKERFENC